MTDRRFMTAPRGIFVGLTESVYVPAFSTLIRTSAT